MAEKVERNVFSLIISKIFAGILVFLAYASLLRYLGAYRTGQYQFSLSFVILFGTVIDFGMQQLVIKKVSENKAEGKDYLGNFFVVELLVAILVYLVLALTAFAGHYDPLVRNSILFAGFGMALNALTIPFTAIISAHEDMHVIAWVNFFDSAINAGIIFLTVLLHRSIVFLSSIQVAMALMHFIVYNRIIRKYISNLELWHYLSRANWQMVKSILKQALPFGTLVGFSIIYNKIDVIILTHLRGYAETGLYTAAYKFFDLLAFFPAVVSSSLYPFFSSNIQQNNLEPVKKQLQVYTKFMIGVGVPLAFGGAMLAQRLVLLVAGKDFYAGYPALQILIFATGTLFIYGAVNSLMINQLTRYAVWITFSNIFINSIGNILLIPHFGFKAAAVMTLVSELTQAITYFYFVNKKIASFAFARNFIVPLAASLVMDAVLWPLRLRSLAVTIPLGTLVYFAVVLYTGYLKTEDVMRVKNIFLGKGRPQPDIQI